MSRPDNCHGCGRPLVSSAHPGAVPPGTARYGGHGKCGACLQRKGGGAGASPNRAKAICAECPVRTECLTWALETREEWGVWGGLTPTERLALRRGVA